MMAMNWLLVTTIGSTILLWNRSFLYLWVGENYYAGSLANLLIVLVMTQTTFIRSDAYLIDATLRLRERVLIAALAAVFSIALSILLTPSLGIIGLCLGLLVGRLVQTLSYPFLVNSCLGRSQRRRLNWVIRPGLVMVLFFACSSYLGMRLITRNWFEWSACVAVSFVLILSIGFAAGLSADSRESVLRRFRQIRISTRSIQ
jgi:O-antigen/teichoic acid export membrane protein